MGRRRSLGPAPQRDLERDVLPVALDEHVDDVAGLVPAEALGVVVDGRDRLAAEADDGVPSAQPPFLGGAPLADPFELDPLRVVVVRRDRPEVDRDRDAPGVARGMRRGRVAGATTFTLDLDELGTLRT